MHFLLTAVKHWASYHYLILIGVSCPFSNESRSLLGTKKHPGFKTVSKLFPGSGDSIQKQHIFTCALGRSVPPTLPRDVCFASPPFPEAMGFCLISGDKSACCCSPRLKLSLYTREGLGRCIALALHPSIS